MWPIAVLTALLSVSGVYAAAYLSNPAQSGRLAAETLAAAAALTMRSYTEAVIAATRSDARRNLSLAVAVPAGGYQNPGSARLPAWTNWVTAAGVIVYPNATSRNLARNLGMREALMELGEPMFAGIVQNGTVRAADVGGGIRVDAYLAGSGEIDPATGGTGLADGIPVWIWPR